MQAQVRATWSDQHSVSADYWLEIVVRARGWHYNWKPAGSHLRISSATLLMGMTHHPCAPPHFASPRVKTDPPEDADHTG